jgi:hypothetical protein
MGERDYQVGDVVKLRSGGRRFTVCGYDPESSASHVDVISMGDDGTFDRTRLSVACIELIEKATVAA